MNKKSGSFWMKYRYFVLVLSFALIATITLGSIRGYADQNSFNNSAILSDESLGNSLGASGAQTLGASTRSNRITVEAGRTPLYLIDNQYKIGDSGTLQSLPENTLLEITPGSAGETEIDIYIKGNVKIQQIQADNIEVVLAYQEAGTTFMVKNEQGDNCIKAKSLTARGRSFDTNKFDVIGNSNEPSIELDITDFLSIEYLDFSCKPNHIKVDENQHGGIYFRDSQAHIQVGEVTESDTGIATSILSIDGIGNTEIVGTNNIDYTVKTGEIRIGGYWGHNFTNIINGKKAACSTSYLNMEGGNLTTKSSAPGSIGLYVEKNLDLEENATITSEGDSTGILFDHIGYNSELMESKISGTGNIAGIHIRDSKIEANGNGLVYALFDPEEAVITIKATLKGNKPDAKGALFLESTDPNIQTCLYLTGNTYLSALSEENSKKGAAITVEVVKPQTDPVLSYEKSLVELIMPSYKNDYSWAFNASTTSSTSSETKIATIEGSYKDEMEIHYTKPITIYYNPTKPYDTNASFTDYTWTSTPPTTGFKATTDGFESREYNPNGILAGKYNKNELFGNNIEVKNKKLNAIYDDVTYTNDLVLTLKGEGGIFSSNNKDTVTKQVTQGSPVGELEVPVRKGYDLVGFFTEKQGAGTHYTAETVFTGTKPLTLYAHWSPAKFNVNFVANDGTPIPAMQSVAYKSLVTEPGAMTKTGHTFKGWYKEDNFKNEWNFATDTMPADDITLYAKWEVNKYKATFHPNGGTPEPTTQTVNYDTVLTKPKDMTKTGYTFKGWFTEPDFVNEWNFTTDKMPAKNIDLYAKWGLKQYDVTFHPNGGTPEPTTQTLDYQSLVPKPGAMTKTGYTFQGWYKENSFQNEWNFASDKVPAKNIDLYAKWEINKYKVTFHPNGGTPGPVQQNVKYQSLVTEPGVMTKTGHTFKGWYKDAGLTQPWNFATDKVPAKDIDLYAKWEVNKYKVTFHPNGGTPEPAQQNVKYQSLVTEPGAMTKTGHTFKGWYKDTGLTQPWNFATDKVPANHIDLYAKWEVNKYKVTFHPNGGTPGPVQQNVKYQSLVTEPGAMTKTGHTFKGWYKDAGLTQPWNFATDKVPAKDIDLYAKWEVNKYKVTFHPNGGTPEPAQQNVKYQSLVTEPGVMTKTGHTFKGWYKDTGLTQLWNFASDKVPANNIDLYAKWEVNKYKVTFHPNGGTPGPVQQNVKYQSLVTEPGVMTKTGHTFKGWYKDTGLTQPWNFAADKVPANNIDLYAKWEVNKYKVTFHPNGGTPAPAQQNVKYQSLVTEPGVMTKTGHTFKGWYKDAGLTQPWNFASDKVPAKNIDLYAKWEVNKYQMNFVANGGTPAPAPVNVTYNTLAKEPAKMTKAGYTFGGWYKDTGFTQPWNFTKDKMPANNVTLYAQWKEITYTANFDPNGGTPKPASVKVKFGKKIPTPVTVTKIGYNFTNWYKGSSVWNFATNTMPNSDITLKAGWVVDPNVKFKVNFDPNGGTLDYLQKEYPAETVIPVPNGVRPGYTLDHWRYNGRVWKVGVDKTPNKDITLIAQWKIDPNQKIQVTFDAKGGAPTPPAQTHMVEELISKPSNPTRYGYIFSGWIYKDTGKLWNFEKTKIADKNFPGPMVMNATWKPDPTVKFTVTFDPGPLGTVTPTSEQHVAEEKINKPKASRHGYALQGWKKDDGTYWNFKTDRMPAKDITLKADWKFDPTAKVTVEFDANRGKPTPPNQLVPYGEKVVEPTNVIRPGYNLTGWKLLRDGKIWDFENDTIEQKHFDDRFVLQAQWKVDPAQLVTVRFDAQGGKPVPNFQRIIPMEQLLTSPAIPVKHRYEFLGWFTEPEEGRYWNFEKDLAPPEPKEFVLYAHWQRETGPGKSNPDPGYHGETPMPGGGGGTGQGKNPKLETGTGIGTDKDINTGINPSGTNQQENAPVLEDTGIDNETVTPQNPNPSTGGTKARISGYLHKMTTGDDLTIDGVVVEPLRARDAVVMIAIPVILIAVVIGAIYTFVKKRKKQ